jgi:hypothetical protein
MKSRKIISSNDRLFESVRGLVESIEGMNREALRTYTPVVEDILLSRSRDVHYIEHTLDGLLDFCGYAPVLILFKKLCRHYLLIDPAATASYVNIYREMWDAPKRKNLGSARKVPAGRRLSASAATRVF